MFLRTEMVLGRKGREKEKKILVGPPVLCFLSVCT